MDGHKIPMKIKTSKLIGPALDWAVAKCSGWSTHSPWDDRTQLSKDWSQGGPIIEKAEIQLSSTSYSEGYWCYAQCMGQKKEYSGPNPLTAAMRCYVASKLGMRLKFQTN